MPQANHDFAAMKVYAGPTIAFLKLRDQELAEAVYKSLRSEDERCGGTGCANAPKFFMAADIQTAMSWLRNHPLGLRSDVEEFFGKCLAKGQSGAYIHFY